MRIKIPIVVLIVLCSSSFKPNSDIPDNSNLYLHKIVIWDSSGHQIIKGWKIFTSTNNKYTYVTSSDSENVILNVSESSNFCLYLDSNKNSINFHLYDVINPFKWDKNNDLNLNFEYNVYIQLYKHINPVTLGKGVVKNDSTFFNERPKSTFNERFYPICDDKSTYLSYLVAFVGNSKISDKGRRTYRRLEYKPLK